MRPLQLVPFAMDEERTQFAIYIAKPQTDNLTSAQARVYQHRHYSAVTRGERLTQTKLCLIALFTCIK